MRFAAHLLVLAFLAVATACAATNPKLRYPQGSFGPLVDDPHFSYWEDRRNNEKTGDYIYELGYQASASTDSNLLKKYVEMRVKKLCPAGYEMNKYEETTAVSLCGDGTELRFVDAEAICK